MVADVAQSLETRGSGARLATCMEKILSGEDTLKGLQMKSSRGRSRPDFSAGLMVEIVVSKGTMHCLDFGGGHLCPVKLNLSPTLRP